MEDPRPVEAFRKAVAAVFAQWTLLTLAVEQGWGGRESHRKRQNLYEEVLDVFKTEKAVCAEDLADRLSERLLTDFSVEADDDSDLEVASLLVELHEQTQRGCLDLALAVQQQQRQRATAASQSRRLPADGREDADASSASEGEKGNSIEALLGESEGCAGSEEATASRTRSRLAAVLPEKGERGEGPSLSEETEGWETVRARRRSKNTR